jgi:transposase
LRSRFAFVEAQAADLESQLSKQLALAAMPNLLDQPGVGVVTGAQILVSWSQPGRLRNEAAFAASPAPPRYPQALPQSA